MFFVISGAGETAFFYLTSPIEQLQSLAHDIHTCIRIYMFICIPKTPQMQIGVRGGVLKRTETVTQRDRDAPRPWSAETNKLFINIDQQVAMLMRILVVCLRKPIFGGGQMRCWTTIQQESQMYAKLQVPSNRHNLQSPQWCRKKLRNNQMRKHK